MAGPDVRLKKSSKETCREELKQEQAEVDV
jgi:hypothetical protein